MKKILLLLLITTSSFAGTHIMQNDPSVTVGSITVTGAGIVIGGVLQSSAYTSSVSGSSHTFYASQIPGVVLDCNINTGFTNTGGTCTNNTTAFNAVLQTATSTSPVTLIIDGGSGISGLKIPSLTTGGHVTIKGLGWDTGFFILTGSNSPGIYNSTPPFDGGVLPASRGGNIILQDFMINGNRGTYPNGDSSLGTNGSIDTSSGNSLARERGGIGGFALSTLATGVSSSSTTVILATAVPSTFPTSGATILIDSELMAVTGISGGTTLTVTRAQTISGWSGFSGAAAHSSGARVGNGLWWYTGIDLATLDHVSIQHVRVYDAPSYGIRLANVGVVTLDGGQVEFSTTTNQAPNTDGIHIDGPANDIHISNYTLTLTGDDPIALNLDEGFGSAGARIVIDNITEDRTATGIRIYGNGATVKSVAINNVVATNRDQFLVLGAAVATSTDAIQDVTLSNISITPESSGMTQFGNIATNIGSLSLNNVTWISPPSGATTWFAPQFGSGYTISNLRLNNVQLYQNTSGAGTPSLLDLSNGVSYKTVTIQGFSVGTENGVSGNPLPYLINANGGTIGRLVINDLDPSNIESLVNYSFGYSGISLITGPGVESSAFTIPEGVMDQYSIFVSSTGSHFGIPCVKISTTTFPWFGATASSPTAHADFGVGQSGGYLATNRLEAASSTSVQASTSSFSVFSFINSNAYNVSLQAAVAKLDPASVNSGEYMLFYENGTNAFAFLTVDTANSATEVNGNTAPTAGQWYFVVGIHDASTPSARLDSVYLNGSSSPDSTPVSAGSNPVEQTSVNFSVLAPTHTSGSPWPVDGKIAMSGKINKVLSSADMTYLYNGGAGRSAAEINAHFTSPAVSVLYEYANSGSLGTDSSANGNNASPVGTIFQTTGPN